MLCRTSLFIVVFFMCPISLFITILLCHVTFYKHFYIYIYIIIILYKTSMSIFVFYKMSTSILQFLSIQFLLKLTSDSTTFKVAVSHFVFTHVEPCIFRVLNFLSSMIFVCMSCFDWSDRFCSVICFTCLFVKRPGEF